ncbi:MAG TPA: UvrB/UvrC motif-containing protein [Opitutales bacterium]|nr:UvrB/UvrC motif-containing protein [Opitutales bacterium]
MGENLKCSNCDNQATVHLTQIINNKIIKVDLCESCAQAKGVTDPEGFSLADLLNKTHVPAQEEDRGLQCPDCNLTSADFRRSGRMGCATCFTVFASVLRPVLEDMHVGTSHKGKVPQIALSRQSVTAELEKLEEALAKAIDEEAYEDAAKYRDEIKSLKKDKANYEFSQT